MTDNDVALSNLAKQAPFVELSSEDERRVMDLIAEIKSVFDKATLKG